jgi:hypothetical protein
MPLSAASYRMRVADGTNVGRYKLAGRARYGAFDADRRHGLNGDPGRDPRGISRSSVSTSSMVAKASMTHLG